MRKPDKHDVIYWFTIAWDGYEGMDEGEMTESRYTLFDMKEAIKHYLDKYKARRAYLECCSMETPVSYVDLTDKIRSEDG